MLYYRELNELLTMIELEVYNNDGIIYDTFVCDRILAKHNTNIYIKNKLCLDKFYDISYNPETKDRFIKNPKIKVVFKQHHNFNRFIKFIENNMNKINELRMTYKISISNQEAPPFKNNNYICYGLLMEKNNIYYSNNTGTPYDYVMTDELDKKIINDIINKRTQYIRGFHSNNEIFNDIFRMINDGWKITNLPYDIVPNDSFSEFCPICLEQLIVRDTEIVKLYENVFYKDKSNNYKIHHDCLIKFFKTQQKKIFFKCPYRYVIDFNSCKFLIDYKIIHNN
jgi:hypothetical protein